MDLYQILCTIHNYQTVWSDTLVTTCPVNANDEINLEATCIISSCRICSQISPNVNSTSSSSYVPILTCVISPASYGTLKICKILSDSDNTATSYSVTLFDKTNSVTIASSVFTNNTGFELNSLGEFQNQISSDPTILELRAKVDGGSGNCYISDVIFYSY